MWTLWSSRIWRTKVTLQIVSASFALVATTACGPKFFNEGYFDDLVNDQNPVSLGGPTSFSITDISPTSNNPLSLSIGAIPPDAVDYCIQENNTSATSCVWSGGAPLATYSPTTTDGNVVLSIWLRDSSGTVSSRVDSNQVYVDYIPPVIASLAVTNVSPTNSQIYTLAYGAITGTYAQYCLRENNTSTAGCSWNSGSLPATFTVSSTENAKILSLWLRDAAGNLSNRVDSNSVTLDLTVPQLASVSITNPSPTSSTTLNLSFGAVSNGPYTQYCIKENNTALAGLGDACWVATTLPATFTATAADGNKVLSVWIRDAAGNISNRVDSNTVYLDQSVPLVAITAPAANAPINIANQATFTISGTCSEDGRTVSVSGAATGSATCSSGSWSVTLNLTGLANNSSHTFYADHSDAAGNNAVQSSRAFYKDVTAPTVAFSTPAPGSAVNSGNVGAFTITGTCSENGRPVSLGGAVSTSVSCTAGNWSATLDLTAVADGPVSITADHTDANGNPATQASRSFTKDTNPPAVAFSTPSAGAYANASNFTAFVVTGSCSDSGQSVNLSGAVTTSVSCTAGAWTATLDLTAVADGAFTLYADHSDAGANAAPQASRNFNKDTSPVSVAFSTPSAGAYILPGDIAAFTITGTCSENGRTVAIAGPVSANPTCTAGSWSATVDVSAIPDGLLTFTADHSDVGGNNAPQATRGFNKDTAAPTSPLISINAGATYTNTTAVSLTLSVTAAAQMYITNTAGCASGGAWASVNSPEAWTLGQTNGTATVYVKYRDVAGNETACVNDDILHDSVVPLVAFSSPAPGSIVNGASAASFAVSGTCSEDTRTVTISGAVTDSATCSSGTWSKNLDFSAVADGAITIYADHTDAAGNNAVQASLSLTKNTGGGGSNTIAINAGAGYTNSTSVTLTLSSDNYTHQMYVTNTAGCGSGGAWESYATSKAWTLGQTNTTATVYVKFRDVALNETGCINDTIIHDTVAPNAATTLSWTETSPSGSVSLNANWVKSNSSDLANQSIRFYTDAACTVASGAAINLASNSLQTYNWTAPGDGTYYFQVTSIDNVALSTASACSAALTVDTTAPAVAITSPAANSWVNAANVASWTISGTCSEAGRTVSLSGAITDSVTCSGGNTWSKAINMTAVAQGAFTINANHSDAAGNNAPQDSRAFSKDTVLPSVSIGGITGPLRGGQTVSVSWTASDTNFGATPISVVWTTDGWVNTNYFHTNIANTSPVNVTIPSINASQFRIRILAADLAGNDEAASTADLVVDSTNPILAITSPNANTYVSTSNYTNWTVSGTCSENTRVVQVSVADGALMNTPTCTGGAWSTNFSFSSEMSSNTGPQWSSLVGYWKQNNNWNDSKGSLNGTASGGATFTSTAQSGSHAGSFDGVDDFVDFGSAPALNFGTGSFTVSTWIKTDGNAQLGAFYSHRGNTIVGLGIANGDTFNWTSGRKIQFLIYQDGSIHRGGYTTNNVINDANWHHIVAVANSTADSLTIYVDGVAVPVTMDHVGGVWPNITGANYLHLGKDYDLDMNFKGSMDETAVWGRALTTQEVDFIYKLNSSNAPFRGELASGWTPKHSDIVGHWKLNGAGSLSNNSAVSAAIGTAASAKNSNGTGMAYTPTRLKQGVILDGVDDHMIVPGTHGINFGTGAYTVAFWFNKTNATGRGDLFTWKDYNTAGDHGIFVDNNILTVLPANGSDVSGATIPIGVWNHLVYTRTSGGAVTVYLNGSPYLTAANTEDMAPFASVPIYFGSNHDISFNASALFEGRMDEIAMWSNSLSQAEVTTLYQGQAGAFVADGAFTVLAEQVDASGNSAQDSRTFNKDLAPPVVAITSPAVNAYANSSNVASWTISGTCSDPGGTVSLSGAVTDSTVCSGGNTWSKAINLTAVAQGAFTINANFTDAGGNAAAQSSRAFIKDTVAPMLAVTAPNGGESITGTTNITWTASDAASGIVTNASSILLEYSSNGGSTWTSIAGSEANDGTYSWASMTLESTNMLVRITAQDAAGNSSTDVSNAVFTYDTVAPTLSFTSPAANSWININTNASFAVAGNCSDNGRTITFSGAATGTTTCSGTTWSTNLNFSAAAQGALTLNANMSDAAGNAATQASLALRKDTVAPTVTVTAPNGGESLMVGASQSITWTASDATSGVSTRTDLGYQINAGATQTIQSNHTGGSPYSWTVSNAPSTQVKILAEIWDVAGNYAFDLSNANFTIYTGVAPSAPTTLAATAGNKSVALSWTASASGTPTPTYEVLRSTTSGSGYASVTSGLTGTTYTDTSVVNDTTYYYVVRATNAVGTSANSNEASATPSLIPTLAMDFTLGSIQPQIGSQTFTFTRTGSAPVATHHGPDGLLRLAPHNYMLRSDAFNQAAWTKTGSTVTSDTAETLAPDGTQTADIVVEDSSAGSYHQVSQGVTKVASSIAFSVSVYAKEKSRRYVALSASGTSSANYAQARFDLRTGTVLGSTTGGAGFAVIGTQIQAVGDGWFRISLSGTTDSSTDLTYWIALMSTSTTVSYNGNGTGAIYLWGAQTEENRTPSLYLATTTASRFDGPRFDYDPVTKEPKGLRLDENSTNLLLQSERFDNASWTKVQSSVTANTALTLDPMGGNAADILVEDTANSNHQLTQTVTKAASSLKYIGSVYVKAGSRTSLQLEVGSGGGGAWAFYNLSTGVVSSSGTWGTGWTSVNRTITPVGNGWYRIAHSTTSDTTTSVIFKIMSAIGTNSTYTGDGSNSLYVFGAQLEQPDQSQGTVATSGTNYIPTVASAVSRASEFLTSTGGLGSWYNGSNGTWYLDWEMSPIVENGANTATLFRADAGGNPNYRVSMRPGSYVGFDRYNASTAYYSWYREWVGGGVLGVSRFKGAFTINPGDTVARLNGNTGDYTVTNETFSVAATALSFGQNSGSNIWEPFTGWIREARFYNSRLPDADLTSLTSSTTNFADAFDDSTMSSRWTTAFASGNCHWCDSGSGNPGATISETGNQLQIKKPYSPRGYDGYITADTYNFTGASMQIELVEPARYWDGNTNNSGCGPQTLLSILPGSSTTFTFGINNYLLDPQYQTPVAEAEVSSGDWSNNYAAAGAPYTSSPSTYRYLRIRHDTVSDRIFAEYSNNGWNWTSFWSIARFNSLANVRFMISSGNYCVDGDFTEARGAFIDNFRTTAPKNP